MDRVFIHVNIMCLIVSIFMFYKYLPMCIHFYLYLSACQYTWENRHKFFLAFWCSFFFTCLSLRKTYSDLKMPYGVFLNLYRIFFFCLLAETSDIIFLFSLFSKCFWANIYNKNNVTSHKKNKQLFKHCFLFFMGRCSNVISI